MKKFPTKVLSAAALAALISAPAATYSVQAATPVEIPAEGFYVSNSDNSKLYFSLNDLFGENGQQVFDAINAAGFENIYFLQEGAVVTLDGFFDYEEPVAYEDGTIPAGEYKKIDGSFTPPIGQAPVKEFKVESIAAINKTSVTVTFPSDAGVTEAGLEDKTITLKAGDQTLTAEFTSFNEDDKTAVFSLTGNSTLVDATDYILSAEWASFEETSFQARFGPKLAKTFEKVSTEVVAGETATVYFSAKDQYGDSIALTGQNIVAKGTLNGMPLTAEELSYDTVNEVINVTTDVNIGDELVITIGDSTLAYTVIEGEEAKLSTFKIVAPESTIKSGDSTTLSINARNQYNNPFGVDGNVRWVVNGEIVVAQGASTYEFKEKALGEYKVQAFYFVNGKIQDTATITVIVDEQAAQSVIDLIAELDNTAATFADDVAKAREAYDALTPGNQTGVTNLADLVSAEAEVAAVTAVNNVADNALAEEALRNPALGLDLTNYLHLNTAQRADMAGDYFPRGTEAHPNFVNVAAIQAWLDEAVPKQAVKEIVWAAKNGDWSGAKVSMFTAAGVTGVTATNYETIKAALQKAKAELTDSVSIQNVVTEATTPEQDVVAAAVAAVNNVEDNELAEAALRNPALGLDLTNYLHLNTAQRADLAGDYFPRGSEEFPAFENVEAIQAWLDEAVPIQAVIEIVWAANNGDWSGAKVSMFTAAGVTGVTAENYDAVKAALQKAKADLTDSDSIQNVVNEVDAVAAAVDAVNNVADNALAEEALRNPALELDLTNYLHLNTAQRADMAGDYFPRGSEEFPTFENAEAIQAWLDVAVPKQAVEEIVWAAKNGNWSGAKVSMFTAAEVTGVTAENYEAVKAALQKAKADLTDSASIQDVVDGVTNPTTPEPDAKAAALAAVNNIADNALAEEALRNPALGLELTNYLHLNTAQRADLAGDYFPRGTEEFPVFENVEAIQAWLDEAVPKQAVKEIVWAAKNGDWSGAKVSMFTAAGVTGVTAENYEAVKDALQKAKAGLVDSASIQDVVTEALTPATTFITASSNVELTGDATFTIESTKYTATVASEGSNEDYTVTITFANTGEGETKESFDLSLLTEEFTITIDGTEYTVTKDSESDAWTLKVTPQ